MKVIIKNSTVEFQTRDVELLDQDVTFSSATWQYFDLKKSIPNGTTVKSIAIIPQGTTLSAIQIKPYVDEAIANAPIFLSNQYNEENTATNYSGKIISAVGVFANAASFPVTFKVHMELD